MIPAGRKLWPAWAPRGLALACAFALALAVAAPGPEASAADSYRTDVIFLTHLEPHRALALWERVVGPRAEARALEGRAGTVVVHDTPERLARFRALVAALDTPASSGERLYVRPVVHLAPSALAALIREALARPEAPLTLVADDRAQQLVVRATPERYALLDRLARRLDVPAPGGGRAVRPLPPRE